MEGRQTRSKAKAGTSKIPFSRPVTTSKSRRHVEARKLNKKQRTEEQNVCELNQQEQIVEQSGEEHNVEEQHIAQISYHTLKKPCNLVTTSERSRRVKARKPNKNQGTVKELNVKEKNEEQNIEELNVEEQHAAYTSFDNPKRPCNQVTEAERSICVKARKLDRKRARERNVNKIYVEKQNVEQNIEGQRAEKHIAEEQHTACISLASKKSCNSVAVSKRSRCVKARKLNREQRTEEQNVEGNAERQNVEEKKLREHNVKEQLTCDDVGTSARHNAQTSCDTLKKPCNLVTTSESSRRVKAKKPNKNQGTVNELNVKEKNVGQNIEEQNAEELNVEEQHVAYASFDNSKRACNQVTEAERSVCVKARKLDGKQRAWERNVNKIYVEKKKAEQNIEKQKAGKRIVEEKHSACKSLASKKSCNSVTVSKRSRCVKARKLNREKRTEEQNVEEGNAERQNVEEKNLKEHNNVKELLTCDDVGTSARHNAQTSCACSRDGGTDLFNVKHVHCKVKYYKQKVQMSNSNSDSSGENRSDGIFENDGFRNNGPLRRKRKGRGYNKPKWGKLGKESIEFTKDGLCIVPKDARLARYLGSLARNYNLFPLAPIDWRLHEEAEITNIWKIISGTIDWRAEDIPNLPIIRYTLLKRLSKRVRNNRSSLKEKYYTPHIGSPSRFVCGDDRVDNEQWRKMVDYWDNDPKNKVKVERNKVNRKKLKTSHTGGSMTFVRHIAKFKEKYGREPDPIEAYELVHRRKDNNKSWVDVASEQVAANISRELAQLVAIHGEETPELRLQAYVATMGVESHNRVRCYGDLVTPSMVPWVQQTQSIPLIRKSRKGREYASLESTCLDLKEMCEKQSKEIEELKRMVLSSHHQSLHCISEQPPSQHRPSFDQHSPTQNQPNNYQFSEVRQLPLPQLLTSQFTGTSQQYMPHPQFGSYQFSPSPGQFFYPPACHPSFYPPMLYPRGEFTYMLNETNVAQVVLPPRDNQTDES